MQVEARSALAALQVLAALLVGAFREVDPSDLERFAGLH